MLNRIRQQLNTFRDARNSVCLLEAIHTQHVQIQRLSSTALLEHTTQLSNSMLNSSSTSSSPPTFSSRHSTQHLTTAFALMTEAVRRTTGKTYYDVQLRGGLALARGCIAEMQTGEGKTLTTGLPAFLFALAGQGVHVATTNSYLAARDAEELRPALQLLGMSVGVLPDEHQPDVARKAYRCDVTFGTGYDFGFDFLRDQIALRKQPVAGLGTLHLLRLNGRRLRQVDLIQRPHAFAIVDEADSVLIDEATMPLILSLPVPDAAARVILQHAARTAEDLICDEHYHIDLAEKSIELTDSGWLQLHKPLETHNITGLMRPWSTYVEQALRAQVFLKRDIDYVVVDGEVRIVDQNTGRIHPERSWRDGLHQAVEVKEDVEASPEKASEGRVSRQRYFQLYQQLCGLTGTAVGNEKEFNQFYNLPVKPIPTHAPCQRSILSARYFTNNEPRDIAIAAEISKRHQSGQPLLVGTLTIKDSKRIAARLKDKGIPHSVLNGVQDKSESDIISQAGRFRAVTIATNMAGRGTDIKLEPASLDAGGLHVIAAGHNGSQRIDRQLAGRSARQGQPGAVQFFVSGEDQLFIDSRSAIPQAIENSSDTSGESTTNFDHQIVGLQRALERDRFQSRQQMSRQDQWLDDVLSTLANPQELANA